MIISLVGLAPEPPLWPWSLFGLIFPANPHTQQPTDGLHTPVPRETGQGGGMGDGMGWVGWEGPQIFQSLSLAGSGARTVRRYSPRGCQGR